MLPYKLSATTTDWSNNAKGFDWPAKSMCGLLQQWQLNVRSVMTSHLLESLLQICIVCLWTTAAIHIGLIEWKVDAWCQAAFYSWTSIRESVVELVCHSIILNRYIASVISTILLMFLERVNETPIACLLFEYTSPLGLRSHSTELICNFHQRAPYHSCSLEHYCHQSTF